MPRLIGNAQILWLKRHSSILYAFASWLHLENAFITINVTRTPEFATSVNIAVIKGNLAYPELQRRLFVPSWVLLPPQHKQERRHNSDNRLGAMHSCMAARTKGNHQAEDRLPRYPVMHDDLAFSAARCVAYPTRPGTCGHRAGGNALHAQPHR